MSVRRIRNHGQWVWQARVAYEGLRKAAFRATRDEARQAEGELLAELKASRAQAEQEGTRPATLRQLLEFYALDMAARGKGEESVGRVAYTRAVIEALMPGLLDKPVSAINDAEIFAFRTARAREGNVVRQLSPARNAPRADPAEHDQPRPPHAPGDAQAGAAGVPLPGRRVLPRGRDAGAVAPARGGAARARADAVAVPRDRQAGGADPDAAVRDPAPPPRARCTSSKASSCCRGRRAAPDR